MSVRPELIRALRRVRGISIWTNAPLAPFTTIGIGGPAEVLVAAATPQAVAAALALLASEGLEPVVIGAGSNLLVSDAGVSGVVLKLGEALQYVEMPQEDPVLIRETASRFEVVVEAGAALSLPRLSAIVADWGLAGLEFACGIPGSVGGAVRMNAGAHGQELKDVLVEVQVTDQEGPRWIRASDLSFGYRSCTLPNECVVTAVRLGLVRDDPGGIRARRQHFLAWRRKHQPRGARTFGSAFRNPPGESAGRLLDQAGLKGTVRGGAQISSVHANFIVNLGEAKASDVVALMTMMREAVYVKFGVLLEPEVKALGMDFPWVRRSARA